MWANKKTTYGIDSIFPASTEPVGAAYCMGNQSGLSYAAINSPISSKYLWAEADLRVDKKTAYDFNSINNPSSREVVDISAASWIGNQSGLSYAANILPTIAVYGGTTPISLFTNNVYGKTALDFDTLYNSSSKIITEYQVTPYYLNKVKELLLPLSANFKESEFGLLCKETGKQIIINLTIIFSGNVTANNAHFGDNIIINKS